MIEVLLFSFSISIDAFGYSVGFGSKNIKLTRIQFLLLNIINTGILVIFMTIYPKITSLFSSKTTHYMGSILLLVLGLYNCFIAFRTLFVRYFAHTKKIIIKDRFYNSFLTLFDLFSLLLVFLSENLFSTFIFYSTLNHAMLFILASFCFHYIFFIVGFDLGLKIKKAFPFDSRFITYNIFIMIALINLFE